MSTAVHGAHRIHIPVHVDVVWQAMRRFEDLSWATDIDELVVEGQGVGMLRKVRFGGSPDWVLERLTARSDAHRSFSFAVENDAMPGYRDYRADVHAEQDGSGCIIHWAYHAVVDSDAEERQSMLQLLAEGVSSLFASQFDRESSAP